MADDDLAAIEARTQAASRGPWRAGHLNVWQGDRARLIARTDTQGHLNRRAGGASTATEDQANAEFIASARTDVPRLVAEVRRLQMALVKVRAALHDTYPTIADHSGRLKESDAPQAAQTWRDVSRRLDEAARAADAALAARTAPRTVQRIRRHQGEAAGDKDAG